MGFWRDMQEQQGPNVTESRGPTQQVVVRGVQAAAESAYQEMQDDSSDFEEVAEEAKTLSEVEKRLRKSNCYRAMLDQSLFEGSPTEEALEVETEFREFALSRLRELMGITAPKPEVAPEEQFSPEERIALKALAAKVLGRPGVVTETAATPKSKSSSAQTPHFVTGLQMVSSAPTEPKLRTMADPDGEARRGRGRPKGSKNKPRESVPFVQQVESQTKGDSIRYAPVTNATPPAGPTKQVMQVEATKTDGTRGLVELDVTGPVQPQGAVRRAPPMDPQVALAFEQARAAERAASNPLLSVLKLGQE